MVGNIHGITWAAALMILALPSLSGAVCNPHIGLTKPDHRYEEHKDGTVTDLATGLMWKQCPEGMSTTATPCDTGSASKLTWQQALQIANENNASKSAAMGGHAYNDWRLPTLKELKSLSELACYNPAINTRLFPGTPPNYFWSATAVVSAQDHAWSIGFFYGSDRWSRKEDTGHVRLVRTAR